VRADALSLTAIASPERELLLALSRRTLDGGLTARARELARARPSWPRLIATARAHGVLPLVHRHVPALDAADVPVDAREELAAGARRNAARNALFARELAAVLERLRAAGIAVIALKGVALADSLYGDVNLRVSSDLDILVPRAAVGPALRALIELGYERGPGEPALGRGAMERLLDSNMEYALVRPGRFPCPVELHWDFAWRWPGAVRAVEAAWADVRPSTFRGVPALALSPEWELLYLAVPAARHRFASLKWLVDVHERCAAGALDWDRLERMARSHGWHRILAVTLGTARAWLGTELPATIAVESPPSWLAPCSGPSRATDIWGDALSPARLFDRPADRLAYVARLLFGPTLTDQRSLPLPGPLRFLHRGWRPVRLGARGAAHLVTGRVLSLIRNSHRVRGAADSRQDPLIRASRTVASFGSGIADTRGPSGPPPALAPRRERA
jgi:hypothetical protein